MYVCIKMFYKKKKIEFNIHIYIYNGFLKELIVKY